MTPAAEMMVPAWQGWEGGEIEPREAQTGREQMGREPPLPTSPHPSLVSARLVEGSDHR